MSLFKFQKESVLEAFLRHLVVFIFMALCHPAVLSQEGKEEVDRLFTEFKRFSGEGDAGAALKVGQRLIERSKTVFGPNHPNTALFLGNLASLYEGIGNLPKATELYQQSHQIWTDHHGLQNDHAISSLDKIAMLHHRIGNLEKAEAFYIQSLGIKQSNPELAKNLGSSYNNLAMLLKDAGQFRRAEQPFKLAIEAWRNEANGDHEKTAYGLLNLARLYVFLGRFEEADPLFQRSLVIRESGRNELLLAETLDGFAEFRRITGSYAAAKPMYLKSLEIRKRLLGTADLKTAASLNNLALWYADQELDEEAKPLYYQSLEITEEILGTEHKETGISLYNIALLHNREGEIEKGRDMLERALNIFLTSLGESIIQAAQTYDALGGVYLRAGDEERAEEMLGRSVELYEMSLGAEHPDTANAILSQGNLYRKNGKLGLAASKTHQAVEIMEKSYDSEHRLVVSAKQTLAVLFMDLGKYREATAIGEELLALGDDTLLAGVAHKIIASVLSKEGRFQEAESHSLKAFELCATHLGMDHPQTGDALLTLASLHKDGRKYYEMALRIFESRFGPENEHVTAALVGLGNCQRRLGDVEESKSTFRRVVKIREKTLGQQHHKTIHAQGHLAHSLILSGESGAAEKLLSEMFEEFRKMQNRIVSFFPEKDGLVFKNTFRIENFVGSIQSGKIAALYQIGLKGTVLESINRRRSMEQKLKTSVRGQELLSRRDLLGNRLQRLIFERGDSDPVAIQIESELAKIEREIASIVNAADAGIQKVSVEEIEECLNTGEVLVEIFRYNELAAEDSDLGKYAAVLISNGQDPVFVSLGTSQEIDDAIVKYRSSVGEGNLDEEGWRKASALICNLVLTPLENAIGPSKRVIISLDSQLHFVPVHMIRNGDGIPFGQKYQVRYVTSGRDLVRKVTGVKSETAFVLGNPTYRDNAPLLAMAEAEEAAAANLASNLRNGMSNDAGTINLKPLPGTAREIDQLGEKLKEKGYQITSLSREEATEQSLREQIEGAGIVHLATHGFFLSEIKLNEEPGRAALMNGEETINPRTIQDPMFRSGLALSGAQSTFNLWKSGKVPPPSQDGILLAAEANLLNLRGTDLVVLSACETASGEALDGEGVMGLRRAFASAGANNTIMTLWPVNDAATVEVMDAFYEKYLSGIHPAVALAEVQNELYEPFVEKYGEVEAIARLAPFVCMSLGMVE